MPKIHVAMPTGHIFDVDVYNLNSTASVADLEAQIAQHLGDPNGRYTIVAHGRILDPSSKLISHGIIENSSVHAVKKRMHSQNQTHNVNVAVANRKESCDDSNSTCDSECECDDECDCDYGCNDSDDSDDNDDNDTSCRCDCQCGCDDDTDTSVIANTGANTGANTSVNTGARTNTTPVTASEPECPYQAKYTGAQVKQALRGNPMLVIYVLNLMAASNPFLLSYIIINPDMAYSFVEESLSGPAFTMHIKGQDASCDRIRPYILPTLGANPYLTDKANIEYLISCLGTDIAYERAKEVYLYNDRNIPKALNSLRTHQ